MGGIEIHVHEVSCRMSAAGHQVRILTSDVSGKLPAEDRKDGVHIRRFQVYPSNMDLYYTPQIYSAVANGNWDVVHEQGYNTFVAPLAMAAVVILWMIVSFIRFRGMRGWLDLALIAACILLLTGGWTAYVGNATVDYLGPVIHGGMSELMAFITGEATGQQLFHTSSGIAAPMWERITAIMGVAFIMLMLPIGLFYIWRRYRNQTLALTLGCLVVLYPLMQAFRLTTRGWELASRSAAFLFWGISFVLAVGFVNLLSGRSRINNRTTRAFAVVYITVIFVGGALSGWPGWGQASEGRRRTHRGGIRSPRDRRAWCRRSGRRE